MLFTVYSKTIVVSYFLVILMLFARRIRTILVFNQPSRLTDSAWPSLCGRQNEDQQKLMIKHVMH